MWVGSEGQRGAKQNRSPARMCPCPHFVGQMGIVAATVQSVLAMAHIHVSWAVHKIDYSGSYDPSLPALGASTDAHALVLFGIFVTLMVGGSGIKIWWHVNSGVLNWLVFLESCSNPLWKRIGRYWNVSKMVDRYHTVSLLKTPKRYSGYNNRPTNSIHEI